MYKVFFNNKPVVLEQDQSFELPGPETLCYVFGSKKGLVETINFFKESTAPENLLILSEDKTRLVETFESLFRIIHAAGGVVINDNEEILFIYRLDKWDLPKGKCEHGESYEETALREVTEECGINDLRIEKTLTTTMHTYEQDGVLILKKTHWFEMRYSGNESPVPQTVENITKVAWMPADRLAEVKSNTYNSILNVLNTRAGE